MVAFPRPPAELMSLAVIFLFFVCVSFRLWLSCDFYARIKRTMHSVNRKLPLAACRSQWHMEVISVQTLRGDECIQLDFRPFRSLKLAASRVSDCILVKWALGKDRRPENEPTLEWRRQFTAPVTAIRLSPTNAFSLRLIINYLVR